MKGINGFLKGKVLVACLYWTKLKGNDEVSWCRVNGMIIVVVQKIQMVRKGVAVLLNNVWHIAMIGFGCASSRTLWIKFRFSKVKVYMVVVHGLTEGIVEERERFWNDLDKVVD